MLIPKMSDNAKFGAVLLLGASVAVRAVAAASPAPGLTEQGAAAVTAWFDQRLAQQTPSNLIVVAEQAVVNVMAGGNIYVAGDPGFCDELNFRAGGLAGMKVWTETQRLAKNDVVIIGLFSPNDKGARCPMLAWIGSDPGMFHGAEVVLVANGQWPQVQRLVALAGTGKLVHNFQLLDTGAPVGRDWSAAALNQTATLAVSIAFEGELFAAASRKHKTLAMLTSIFEPGGSAFDDRLKGKTLIEDLSLEPVPAGVISTAYLTACRGFLERAYADGQSERLRQGARRLADCQARGGVIWTVVGGHLFVRGLAVPGELSNLFMYGRDWEWQAPQGLRPGDTLLYIGYLDYPAAAVGASLTAGADAVVFCVDAAPAVDARATVVRTCWERWDGTVAVPGYPYKILPASAVVLTPLLHSLFAEAQALLARPSPAAGAP